MKRKYQKELREFTIAASGSVTFTAADEGDDGPKIRAFSMTAYTGVPMQVGYYYHPVVVDIKGLSISKKPRPILHQHDSSQIVGHTTRVSKEGGELRVDGLVSGASESARLVADSSDNGFPWQASIGARPTKMDFIDEGKKAIVNGREVVGPMYIARKATLAEVSFVSLGADDNTSAKVAAGAAEQQEEAEMKQFEQWLEARGFSLEALEETQKTSLRAMFENEQAVKDVVEIEKVEAKKPDTSIEEYLEKQAAETERVAKIREVCAGSHASIEAKAIRDKWSSDRVELEVLRAARVEAPTIASKSSPAPTAKVIEAALGRAVGQNVEKDFDEATLSAADQTFGQTIGLQEVILHAAREGGYTGRMAITGGNIREILGAAFSTITLPGILSNTANKSLLAGFNAIEQTWGDVSTTKNVSDFKTVTSYRLTGDLEYEQVGPGGEIKHGTIGEQSFTNAALTYAKMLSITRQDIINDDLDALGAIPNRLGRGAALKLNTVFWTEYLADGGTFYTTGRGNYASGAGTALSITSLTAAELLFLNQTDPDSQPLGLNPALLLVPNALFVPATNLMASLEVRPGSDSTLLTKNPHAGKFNVIKSSYLSNANITGYSAAAWYLLAQPQDLSVIEVAFLNGQQTPTIETADVDFSTLGIQMRGYHDFGVNKQEYRAAVKMAGA